METTRTITYHHYSKQEMVDRVKQAITTHTRKISFTCKCRSNTSTYEAIIREVDYNNYQIATYKDNIVLSREKNYSIDDIERTICNTINNDKYYNIEISITNEMD